MFFLKKRRRKAAEDVLARLGANSVLAFDDGANCFGIESMGKGQWRGNGCLGANDKAVCFVMWLPHREFYFERSRIIDVERVRSHLGKTVGRELLKIRFTNDSGAPDAGAWLVRDPSLWEKTLGPHERFSS